MKKKRTLFVMVLSACVALLVFSFNEINDNTTEPQNTFDFSYVFPGDLQPNATEEELAYYAWKEFVALNWKSSWATDNMRTTPDKNWKLSSGGTQPDLAVWETYIHRTELRPANGKRTKDLSSGKPDYTFIDSTIVNQGAGSIDLSNYWNILDEDNEIGSAYLFAFKDEYEVLYAAKTNLREYDYVKKYFPKDTLLNSASARGAKKGVPYFKSLTKQQMCASDSISSLQDNLICLPCGKLNGKEGAVEIKLAFRQLNDTIDDPNRFITKEVVVFKEDTVSKMIKAYPKTFGLIGMHIIHKTENYPTFIFASWEQEDVRNNDMQTIGIDTVTVNGNKYTDVDPHRLNPVIERVIPETLQKVNATIKQQIINANPSSKWQYYRLIGAQATPIDHKDRTGDNNYFMANYVIESDLTLTNFHGSFSDPFNTSIQNVAGNGKSYNMGGCMGCHGQAQVKFGTDFSFLLDQGKGKPVPTPDLYQTYEQALNSVQTPNPKTTTKLMDYIKKLDK